MKRFMMMILLVLGLSACTNIKEELKDNVLSFQMGKERLVLVFPVSPSPEDVAFYREACRRFLKIEKKAFSGEVVLGGERYQDFFRVGNQMLRGWKNLTLRWAQIQQVWENMRWEAERSKASWALPLRGEMLSFSRIRDFENFFQKYQLKPDQLREARAYLIQFLDVEVYFVSLQELMERYARYYTLNDLPTVFFQLVVLPESVEWIEFLQRRYGRTLVRELGLVSYDKSTWEKKLGKPVSDLESEFVKRFQRMKFSHGVWKNLDFVHEYQQLLTLYNSSTKSTLFKK
ncbi:hypothetical protein [Thermospira aquatica]|uniref:Lipoprotein n=1 Tax=Thermospira aquatica TaxID=2828656 RepID=A0AAX3BB56_9SPIR|nr:hypothetical protein [Thermospira aquatica]URA09470.1 hypothetical protein KDW03_08205 [Thermospira aquatica]